MALYQYKPANHLSECAAFNLIDFVAAAVQLTDELAVIIRGALAKHFISNLILIVITALCERFYLLIDF